MNHPSRVNAVSDKPETIANVGANDIFDRLANHEKLLTVRELAESCPSARRLYIATWPET